MFQDFKSQGFKLEDTHLKQAYKLKKLVYLVSLAYDFCLHVGFYYEKHLAPIVKKKHGYPSKSMFRIGLDRLRSMIQRKRSHDLLFWQTLVEAFIHQARECYRKCGKMKNVKFTIEIHTIYESRQSYSDQRVSFSIYK
jgi:hypothetical protein